MRRIRCLCHQPRIAGSERFRMGAKETVVYTNRTQGFCSEVA